MTRAVTDAFGLAALCMKKMSCSTMLLNGRGIILNLADDVAKPGIVHEEDQDTFLRIVSPTVGCACIVNTNQSMLVGLELPVVEHGFLVLFGLD
jgi:hypothetical protein